MLLIVMYESQTWRVRPGGEPFTFGRAAACSAALPAIDRGVSRNAGSFRYHGGSWWLHNDSSSSVLCVLGDRGFRVDLPPGMQVPLQQWHAKITLNGALASYTLRLRLPDLDDAPDPAQQAPAASVTGERAVTSTRHRAPLTGSDRLVLTARFEAYLTWRHAGNPAPASARDTAERIGWQAHTVAKRCENIRDRYARQGVPGLRGPRALEQLALLLVSTGELTAAVCLRKAGRGLPARVLRRRSNRGPGPLHKFGAGVCGEMGLDEVPQLPGARRRAGAAVRVAWSEGVTSPVYHPSGGRAGE